MFQKKLFFLLLTTVFISCAQSKDPVEKRIDELLSRMTLQEKIGQMNQLTGTGLSEDMISQIKSGKVGSILNELDINPILKAYDYIKENDECFKDALDV